MPDDFEKTFDKIKKFIMGGVSEAYSDKVLTLAYEPLNVGEIINPDSTAKVRGSCGDTMQLHLRLSKGRITEARFLTDGCGPTLACGSAITELVNNKTPYEASKIYPQDLVHYLDGLPASHFHCAVLAVQVLRQALKSLKDNEQ